MDSKPRSEPLHFLKRPPVVAGMIVASLHFVLFSFLFMPSFSLCASPLLLLPFSIAPVYVLRSIPFVDEVLAILGTSLRIKDALLLVFVSSCYYGCACGLVLSRQLSMRLVGGTLLSIALLSGCAFIIAARTVGGCGA